MKMKTPLQFELQRVFIGSAGERGTSQSASLTAPLGKGSLWETYTPWSIMARKAGRLRSIMSLATQ